MDRQDERVEAGHGGGHCEGSHGAGHGAGCGAGADDQELIENADGAVVVTTPQEVALAAVRKSITFCRKLDLHVLGIVENMSGFMCPHCGERIGIFGTGGGERLAKEMHVPFLGRIPIEPEVAVSGDAGLPYIRPRHRDGQGLRGGNPPDPGARCSVGWREGGRPAIRIFRRRSNRRLV